MADGRDDDVARRQEQTTTNNQDIIALPPKLQLELVPVLGMYPPILSFIMQDEDFTLWRGNPR